MAFNQTNFLPHDSPSSSSINDKKSPTIKNTLIKQNKVFLMISYSVLLGTVLMLGVSLGLWATKQAFTPQPTDNSSNPRVNFLLDIYDQIKTNYWDKTTDDQLINLYRLGVEKLSGEQQTVTMHDRRDLINLLERWLNNYEETKQQELTVTLGDAILASLTPLNRSRLYSNEKKQELRNVANSTDPNTNLYSILGVDKNAKTEEIAQTYQTKTEQLSKLSTPEVQQQLQTIERAYKTLSNATDRTIYDQTGAEPTISQNLIAPNVLYLKIKQIAPTTIDELKNKINSLTTQNSSSLIIDLRGNFGGAIDTLPYLTGFFIGPNQYAYDYFRQGEIEPRKSVTNKLTNLLPPRKITVLIDKETQSTAEVLAVTLKKYNVGLVIGETTRGWGTVENFFPIKTKIKDDVEYSALIVKNVVLRDDGQPIEGRGVEPNINIKSKDWQKQLATYYNDANLTITIVNLLNNK